MKKLSILSIVFIIVGVTFLSGCDNTSSDDDPTVAVTLPGNSFGMMLGGTSRSNVSKEIDFFKSMGIGQDISDHEARQIDKNICSKINSISDEFEKKKLGGYLNDFENINLKKNFWDFVNKHFPLKSTKINTLPHDKFLQASKGKKLIYFAVPKGKGPEYVVEMMKSCECLPYFYKKSSDINKQGTPIDASAENILSTGNNEKQVCLTAFYDPAKANLRVGSALFMQTYQRDFILC